LQPRSIRTLAVAVAFAVVPARAQEAEGLRLKIEKQLRMAPTRPERDSAKFIEADRIEGSQDKNVVATGNVTMRQRGATIRADRVDYFAEDQTAIATGTCASSAKATSRPAPRSPTISTRTRARL
jgi:lipopolysaccharide assembly outer membrane protein LptD (OstA)